MALKIRIALGADHGGFRLKEALAAWLRQRGHDVVDRGTHDEVAVDYPVIAAAVAAEVSAGRCELGVIIDGAGIGSAMVANKFAGVRAALCYDLSSARNSREHNDANVLTLGAGLIGPRLAEQILETWLETHCEAPRHLRRVAMIERVVDPQFAMSGAGATGRVGVAEGPCACSVPGGCACLSPVADLHLARSPGRPQDAPATDASFQASAARFIMTDSLAQLSPADLDRIAARIAERMAPAEQRAGKWCFGDTCIDATQARAWIDAGVARLSANPGDGPQVADIASYVDHTLLKPSATQAQIEALCDEARAHSFASVCVNPTWVELAARRLVGSPVLVCTVVGFPLGANVSALKAMEARRAIRDGAKEIDMVINIGALKGGDDELVLKDIRAVVDACDDGGAICKVIIETALLSDDEKVRACQAARKARADFVKTSTGFASGGATVEDVALMSRAVAGARMGVKASGGVKTLADLDAMVRAGATRIGASAGVKILKEAGG